MMKPEPECSVCAAMGRRVTYSDHVAVRQSLEVPDTLPAGPGELCDRCPAMAVYRVILRTGDLVFCAHHHRAYGNVLAQLVAVPSSL